jgi:hypothetical protein
LEGDGGGEVPGVGVGGVLGEDLLVEGFGIGEAAGGVKAQGLGEGGVTGLLRHRGDSAR